VSPGPLQRHRRGVAFFYQFPLCFPYRHPKLPGLLVKGVNGGSPGADGLKIGPYFRGEGALKVGLLLHTQYQVARCQG